MIILAIDPAPKESGYCLVDSDDYAIKGFGKENNYVLANLVECGQYDFLAIEMIKNMGMPAIGQEVFDTCVWIGRFIEKSKKPFGYVFRYEEKMNLCGSMKAKDANIRQALIDRFGEVGTKKNPGFFYGFKADMWSAFAIAVTYIDYNIKHTSKD